MPHVPWQMVLIGIVVVTAATMVAGRRGFVLTLAALLAAGWSWLYPHRALALFDTGTAWTMSFLRSNPLAEFTGGLPLLNPLWFVVLAGLVLVMVGKLAFSTRVE